ncbi:cytochrome P450, partial [Corynespora cassiicola Philippines]
YQLFLHPLHKYPGPLLAKLTNFYGVYYAFSRQLAQAADRNHQRYGPVVHIYKNEQILKSTAYQVSQPRPGVFNMFNVRDKNAARTKRKIIGQGLNAKAMREFEPVMTEHIDVFIKSLFDELNINSTVDILEACSCLAIDVSVELGFGHSLELQTNKENRWLKQAIQGANWRINLLMQNPWLKKARLDKLMIFMSPNVLKYYGILMKLIQARRALDWDARPDWFNFILDHRWYIPFPTSSDSSLTKLLGGDTTAAAMSAAFFYLSRYPKVYSKLAAEIRTTFSSAAEIRSGPQLSSCAYLRAVLTEALRLSSPVNGTLWRDTPSNTTPLTISSQVIPPGTCVGVNTYTLHHNAAYFPRPYLFSPARWLPPSSGLATDGEPEYSDAQFKAMEAAFAPFSVGARSCAGTSLAWLEMSLVFAKTFWFFEFETEGTLGEGWREGCPVFEVGDTLVAWHVGPELRFRKREGVRVE